MTPFLYLLNPIKGDKGDQGKQGVQGIQGFRGDKGEKGTSIIYGTDIYRENDVVMNNGRPTFRAGDIYINTATQEVFGCLTDSSVSTSLFYACANSATTMLAELGSASVINPASQTTNKEAIKLNSSGYIECHCDSGFCAGDILRVSFWTQKAKTSAQGFRIGSADGRSITVPETPAATNVLLETVLQTEDIMPDGGIRIYRYSSDAWLIAIAVVREEGLGSTIQYLFNARGEKGDRGEKGSIGPQGEPGVQGPQGVAGTNGIDGRDGKDGTNGTNGLSAYEIAVQQGFSGTVDEWLSSLIGEKGEPGSQGQQGEKGDKGETGEKGEIGAVGPQGEQGPAGTNGLNGKDGANGIGLKGIIQTTITTRFDAVKNRNFIESISNLDEITENGLYLLQSANGADSIMSVEKINENYTAQYVMVGGFLGINTQKFIARSCVNGNWTEWQRYDILSNKQNALYNGEEFTLRVGDTLIQMTEQKLQKLKTLLES